MNCILGFIFFNLQMSSLQNHLESAENQIQILSHSLSDKQAQLDISNNNSNVRSLFLSD